MCSLLSYLSLLYDTCASLWSCFVAFFSIYEFILLIFLNWYRACCHQNSSTPHLIISFFLFLMFSLSNTGFCAIHFFFSLSFCRWICFILCYQLDLHTKFKLTMQISFFVERNCNSWEFSKPWTARIPSNAIILSSSRKYKWTLVPNFHISIFI